MGSTHFLMKTLEKVKIEMNLHVLAVTYMALVNGLIHNWMLDQSRHDLVAAADAGIDVFLNGLR